MLAALLAHSGTVTASPHMSDTSRGSPDATLLLGELQMICSQIPLYQHSAIKASAPQVKRSLSLEERHVDEGRGKRQRVQEVFVPAEGE